MTHNSRKAWKNIRKLSNDPTTSNPPWLVSANQVAHQLLVDSIGTMPSKPKRPVLPTATEGDYSMIYPFSEEEYRKGVSILKNNKASGRDHVLVEQQSLWQRSCSGGTTKASWSQSPQMAAYNAMGARFTAYNAKQLLHGK